MKTFCSDHESELLHELRKATGKVQEEDIAILSRRSGRWVVRLGDVVAKVQGPDTDSDEWERRFALLSSPSLYGIFLRPWREVLIPLPQGRWVTLWPWAKPVESESDSFPWKEAAELLARLHRAPLPQEVGQLPRTRAAFRLNSVLERLAKLPGPDARVRTVLAAARTLRGEWPEHKETLVHGDWHLGQMVFDQQGKTWRLIDPDDLGLGNPLWDLARPAAFFAAGLIHPDQWREFLEAYQRASGPALPAGEDVWSILDRPARSLVVQCAANALLRNSQVKEGISESEDALIEVCRRIASFSKGEIL